MKTGALPDFARQLLADFQHYAPDGGTRTWRLLSGLEAFAVEKVDERRRFARIYCNFDTTVLAEGAQVRGTVLDVGLGGIRMELESELEAESDVRIECPESEAGSLPCQVLWCQRLEAKQRFTAGLRFAGEPREFCESWVGHLLWQLGYCGPHVWNSAGSCGAGTPVSLEVGEASLRGVVHNLGLGGVLLSTPDPLPGGVDGLRLTLDRAADGEPLQLSAALAEERPGDEGSTYAIAFQGLQLAQVNRLGNLVLGFHRGDFQPEAPQDEAPEDSEDFPPEAE